MSRPKVKGLDIINSATVKILLSINEKIGAYKATSISLVSRHSKISPSMTHKIVSTLHENKILKKEKANNRTLKLILTKEGEILKWHLSQIRNILKDLKVVQSG